ncbi:hypothetical protein [Candidatus Ruthturnera calyptogenae]|uniref:hypothetical protein n=1 Tax=Candidatus Ruthturnera calyptogenae TaxID=386487 RepID=UPI0002DE8610|nr:hypothetical protein [Candidatus Ruthturnera calyptogenae]
MFTSKIKLNLQKLYEKTDIHKKHTKARYFMLIFCCQPFSKAGNQQGLNDKK